MMPSWASQAKVDATRAYGGTADVDSADAAEAFARMDAEAEKSGRVIVHPFNDRAVMAGQGTLGLELCEQVDEVTQVVGAGRRWRPHVRCGDGRQGALPGRARDRRRAGRDRHGGGLDRGRRARAAAGEYDHRRRAGTAERRERARTRCCAKWSTRRSS